MNMLHMRDLSGHQLLIGREAHGIAAWFQPVYERGRGAAFVDTGFIKALIDYDDARSSAARRHFKAARGVSYYTTSLVLAEVARQIAKERGQDFPTRAKWFDRCTELIIDSERIFVCAPPREMIIDAYLELAKARMALPALDLCDALSVVVLDYAQHRRVFGFDDHFRSFGAQLEP